MTSVEITPVAVLKAAIAELDKLVADAAKSQRAAARWIESLELAEASERSARGAFGENPSDQNARLLAAARTRVAELLPTVEVVRGQGPDFYSTHALNSTSAFESRVRGFEAKSALLGVAIDAARDALAARVAQLIRAGSEVVTIAGIPEIARLRSAVEQLAACKREVDVLLTYCSRQVTGTGSSERNVAEIDAVLRQPLPEIELEAA